MANSANQQGAHELAVLRRFLYFFDGYKALQGETTRYGVALGQPGTPTGRDSEAAPPYREWACRSLSLLNVILFSWRQDTHSIGTRQH
jgi:hypothetical protein